MFYSTFNMIYIENSSNMAKIIEKNLLPYFQNPKPLFWVSGSISNCNALFDDIIDDITEKESADDE